MKGIGRTIIIALLLVQAVGVCHGQAGGNFEITTSVIASGGERSAGGDFEVDATLGQPIGPEYSRGPGFAVTPGFWTFTPLTPTAAGVTITGRIATADGTGIRNVRVLLSGGNGPPRAVMSTAFGYYLFEDVPVGTAYTITVSAKRYSFAEPSTTILVLDSVADVDFTAEPLATRE